MLVATLNLTYSLGLTDFDYVYVDGTIIKATNSLFNVIYDDDALKVLELLLSDSPSEDAIDDLLPAKSILIRYLMSLTNLYLFSLFY